MPLIGQKIETTTDNFGDMVRENCLLVDKTLMIKAFLDGQKVSLITRPRRFGKTMAMSMLQHFLSSEVIGESTQGLFDAFAIARVDGGAFLKKHQGQYPVIFVSFKDVKESTFEGAINSLRCLIQELYRAHQSILDLEKLPASDRAVFERYRDGCVNTEELCRALRVLTECLYVVYGKKVILLIDEYDTPLASAYEHKYIDDLSALMRNLFSAALKSNPHLEKGLLTGILRVSQNTMLSGLNNLEVYTLLQNEYAQYFGFTEAETLELTQYLGITEQLDRIRDFYNGYKVGDTVVYNPWSLMHYCRKKELAPYWVMTSNDKLLQNILINSTATVKTQLTELMQGKIIEGEINSSLRYEDLMENPHTLWSLLLFCGYLKVEHSELSALGTRVCQLKIPNREVLQLYTSVFAEWMKEKIGFVDYTSFLTTLIEGNVERFAKKLTGYLLSCTRYHDFTTESDYHCFVLGLLASITSTHFLYSNQSYGTGRPDCLLIPKEGYGTQGIILEFKAVHKKDQQKNIDNLTEESHRLALAALAQIDMQGYAYAFHQHAHITCVKKIGIAFVKRVVTAATVVRQIAQGSEIPLPITDAILFDQEAD